MKNISKVYAWALFLALGRLQRLQMLQSACTLPGWRRQSAADSGISGAVPSHGLTGPALTIPAAGRKLSPCFAPLWPAIWRLWAAMSGFQHRRSVRSSCSRCQRSAAFGRRAGSDVLGLDSVRCASRADKRKSSQSCCGLEEALSNL